METNTLEIDPVGEDAEFTSTTVTSPQPAPAAVALSLAAGHLIEAGVHAHRFMSLADAARRMGISAARATRLAVLMSLAPEIQSEVLALRAGGPLGGLSARALSSWSVLTPTGASSAGGGRSSPSPSTRTGSLNGCHRGQRSRRAKRGRHGDQALGDLPLTKLAEVAARRRGHRDTAPRREALLAALVDAVNAPTILPDVAIALSMAAARLEGEFQRLHGHRPACRHPEYVR